MSQPAVCGWCWNELDGASSNDTFDIDGNATDICGACRADGNVCASCFGRFHPMYSSVNFEIYQSLPKSIKVEMGGWCCEDCANMEIEHYEWEQRQIQQRQIAAANIIKRHWKQCRYDPSYKMCHSVQLRNAEAINLVPSGTTASVWAK